MNESIKNKLRGLLVLAVAAQFGRMGWQQIEKKPPF